MVFARLKKALGLSKKTLADDEDAMGSTHEQSGQTKTHIFMNAVLQVAMTIAFVFNVKHETYPKPPDVMDQPGLGEPGENISLLHNVSLSHFFLPLSHSNLSYSLTLCTSALCSFLYPIAFLPFCFCIAALQPQDKYTTSPRSER